MLGHVQDCILAIDSIIIHFNPATDSNSHSERNRTNKQLSNCHYHSILAQDKNLEDYIACMGQDSSVSIATGYGLDGPEIKSQ
jgi:hypothetical protein